MIDALIRFGSRNTIYVYLLSSLLLAGLTFVLQDVSAQSYISPPPPAAIYDPCIFAITNPSDGSYFNDNTPTISGTKTAENFAVIVYVGSQQVGISPASTDCFWSVTVDSAIQDGTYTISAAPYTACEFCDISITATIDTSPPYPPDVTSPASGSTTNDNRPIISGISTEPSVQILLDGKPMQGTVDYSSIGDAAPQFYWQFQPAAPIIDGDHEISAISIDLAGNPSAESKPVDISIDTIPPGISNVDFTITEISEKDVGNDFGIRVNFDDIMDEEYSPNISFVPDVSSSLELLESEFASSNIFVAKYRIIDTDAEATEVGISVYNAADQAGNMLESGSVFTGDTFDIDTRAPNAPEITYPTDLSTVETVTPTILGIGELGATITVYDGSSVLGTATVADDGSWAFLSPELTKGTHFLHSTAIDKAGNTGPDSSPTTLDVIFADSPITGTDLGPLVSLEIDPTSNTWGSPFHASGKARGYSTGDTVTVSWGDGSSTTNIPISTLDGSWGPVDYSYSPSSLSGASETGGVKNTAFAWLMNDKTAKATSKPVDLTILKRPSAISVVQNSADADGNNILITGKLVDTITGDGLANTIVEFALGSGSVFAPLPATTLDDGSFSTTLAITSIMDKETIVVSFKGNDLYAATIESLVLTITGGPPIDDGTGVNGNSGSTSDNLPPIPKATVESTDKMVKLDGTSSTDPDGDILSYRWIQTAGPQIDLLNPETANPSFIPPQADSETKYQFRLIVADGTHEVAADVDAIVAPTPKVSPIVDPIVLGAIAAVGAGSLGAVAAAKHFFRRPKFPVLSWTIQAPSKIRADGTAFIDIKVKNVGEADAKNVKIEVLSQTHGLDTSPSELIETLVPWQSKNLSFRVSENGKSSGPYEVQVTMQSKWVPRKELTALVTAQEMRWNPKKEANFTFSSAIIELGILRITDPKLTDQDANDSYSAIKSWLETRHFNVEVIDATAIPSMSLQRLLKHDTILIISTDEYSVTAELASLLDQYLRTGRGLILYGGGLMAQPSRVNSSKATALYDQFGYDGGSTKNVTIVNGFGLRVTNSEHPLTRGLETGDVFRLVGHKSRAVTGVVNSGQVIMEQLAALKDDSAISRATIPAITTNVMLSSSTIDGQGRQARTVHFNFATDNLSGIISQLVERAILWTTDLSAEKSTGDQIDQAAIPLEVKR